MALVLSMRRGDDVYVGDRRFVVSAIENPYKFSLTSDDGNTLTIDYVRWVPLPGFKDVYVIAGTPKSQYMPRAVSLVIDAPQVEVLRGPVYRQRHLDQPTTEKPQWN